MINYGLMRGDKSQLNKNNTGLHAAGEESVLNAQLHFPSQTHTKKKDGECFCKAPTPQGALIYCSEGVNCIPLESWRLAAALSKHFSLSLSFFLLLQHQRSAVYHDKDIFSHLDKQDNQLFQLEGRAHEKSRKKKTHIGQKVAYFKHYKVCVIV